MRLIKHVALVDRATNHDGDIVEALCGKRQPGYRNPPPDLFACHKCMVALQEVYEEAHSALGESHATLSLIRALVGSTR